MSFNKMLPSVDEASQIQRQLIVKQVRRWGGVNSDAILDPSCKLFSVPYIEGLIGYQIESKCAIVFGDPVCDPVNKLRLSEAFSLYCKNNAFNIVYTIVSQEFASALNTSPFIQIQFGNKLTLDPSQNLLERKGSKGVLVRKKVKHATKEGVTISEYLTIDPVLEDAIDQIGLGWLKSRRGPQVYIAHLNLFADREGKRWFYAKQGDKVIGLLILNEIQASHGWLLNNLMTTPDAPSGTSEMLIIAAFNVLETENCQCVIVGPVTAQQLHNSSRLAAISVYILNVLFKTLKKIFALDGQTRFWEKFQSDEEPSFLIFDRIGFNTLRGILRAFNVKFFT